MAFENSFKFERKNHQLVLVEKTINCYINYIFFTKAIYFIEYFIEMNNFYSRSGDCYIEYF